MENIKLYVYVVLKHILDLGQRSPIDELDDDDDDDDDDDEQLQQQDDEDKTRKDSKPNRKRLNLNSGQLSKLDLLDLEGPKLMVGARTWIIFYQIIGQVNWIGKPLYVSLAYKLAIYSLVTFHLGYSFLTKIFNLNIISTNYRNPIFLFITFLTVITLFGQGVLSVRANLNDLCPFLKILITPKLCFVREEVQHIVGTRWLKCMLIFFVYHSVLVSMLVSKDLQHFIDEFTLVNFLTDLFTITVVIVSMTGMSLPDLYIRTCFGHWLLALKSHIECRFTYLHKHQRRMMKLRNQLLLQSSPTDNPPINNINSMDALSISETITTFNTAYDRPLLTFDEIQKHLNKMDDHLEATRSVQIGSLVLLSLNAFLLNGSLFLLTYHLLADQHNFYHGILVLLVAINSIFIMFLCYSGDRWVFYALSSFTQTVEDEYFMQSDIRPITSTINNTNPLSMADRPDLAQQSATMEQLELESQSNCHSSNHHMLLIKKKDVLFCHEFLHQFENHLATPWSNLTVKTHLHMLRTFVTLIAAQIIFDHEH